MFEEAPEAWIREVYVSASFASENLTSGSLPSEDLSSQGLTSEVLHSEGLLSEGWASGILASGKLSLEGLLSQDLSSVDLPSQGLTSETKRQKRGLRDKLRKVGCEIVADNVFAKMSDTQTPQGILTVLHRPTYRLEELLQASNPLFVVLENLQDPGNLGTILRTGEGAGITGVIMSRNTVDIFNPKTIRSTMGSVYRVPFLYVDDLEQTIGTLRDHGVKTYAAHLAGEQFYDEFSYREPTAFLIGNEGNGLTQETARCANSYLKIPMEGQLESLNAAVATALLIYEAHRQRMKTGG